MLIAIDPGCEESAWVALADGPKPIISFAKQRNEDVLAMVSGAIAKDGLCIESMQSYGMPVGSEVFETCIWIGRYWEAWRERNRTDPMLLYRPAIKAAICGTARASDADVRAAMIKTHGIPGTKKRPGPTYGITADCWSALAIATTAMRRINGKRNTGRLVSTVR